MERSNLTRNIVAALVSGIVVGLLINLFGGPMAKSWLTDGVFHVLGQIFFSGLKLLVVPVVLFSLICGTAAMEANLRKFTRIGLKTVALYMASTMFAIAFALLIAVLIGPGIGFQLQTDASFTAKAAPTLAEVIIGFVPTNPVQAMAEANMIQIIVLAGLIGISMSMAGERGRRVLSLAQDLNEVFVQLVNLIIAVAPIGVFCLLAKVFSEQGFSAIAPLSKYFFVTLAALILHVSVTYGTMLTLLARLNPLVFFKKFREVMVFAFSTSSSNATLPVTIENVEEKMGVKNSIASFTLPLGATINMDGTAIMQGVATVFISQAYGIPMGFEQYLVVIGMATLASVGTAGVPGVGLVTLAMVLSQVGLPVEGIGLIIGVDRLLDMTRTVVNVTGDATVTMIVAKSEGQFNQKTFDS